MIIGRKEEQKQLLSAAMSDNSELIANEYSTQEICERIGADSLGYMHLEDLPKMTGDLPLCKACFDNHYPT